MAEVPSMISLAAMPATGEPRMTRGVSPHASVVDRPTDSSRRQISGTSSTRTQCTWMFWRSLMSAVSRANSVLMAPMTRSCSFDRAPPSERMRIMKYESSSSSGASVAVLPPSMPGRRWVYRPHQRIRPRRSSAGMDANPLTE